MQRWLVGLLLLLMPTMAWAQFTQAQRESTLLAQRVGYGATATGGAGGTLCTVSNLNDTGFGSLRACLSLTTPQWVIFSVSGTINLQQYEAHGGQSNKTIDGRGQSITINMSGGGVFYLTGTRNWIIHDVSFNTANPGTYQMRVLCSEDIWLDHVDMRGAFGDTVTLGFGYQGGDCGGTSPTFPNNITVSWSKFHDRCNGIPFGSVSPQCGSGMILIGQGDTETLMTSTRVTLHHNWYQQSGAARFPHGRLAWVHSFNNYLDNPDHGMEPFNQMQLWSQNDILRCEPGVGNPDDDCGSTSSGLSVDCSPGALAPALCKVTNPMLIGSAAYEELNAASVFTPPYSTTGVLETANSALIAKLTHATTGTGAVSNPYNYLAVGTDDIVGWWKFDEASGTSATESSGSGVGAGTLVNMESPTDWVQGLISPVAAKGALEFDGVDEYVSVPDSDLLSPVTTGEFSICAWVRPPSAPTDFGVIAGKGTSGQYEYVFDLDNANPPHVLFVLYPASGSPTHASVTSSTTVPIGAWTHVCGTYAFGVSTNVYINAVNSGTSTAFTGVMTNGTSPVNIGRRPDNLTYLKARVDDLRMLNYALTQPEIAAIMAEGFDIVYHLDDVASPSADSGQPGLYAGTWQNTPTPVIPGKLNNALGFSSASSEYVSVATLPSFSGAASIACWVKMTSLTGTQTFLSNQVTTGGPTQVGLNINSDGSWSYLYDPGTGARGFVSSGAAPLTAVGSWVHLGLTDNGAGTIVLYQSGAAISQTTFGSPTTKPLTAPGPLSIGRRGDGLQYFDGSLDECHLVSRMMSAGEIAALAGEGSDSTPPGAPSNLRVVSP